MPLVRPLCLSWCRLAAALLLVASSAAAHTVSGDCFEQAGTYQDVNPTMLRVIVWFGSKGNVDTIHRSADGSVDIGQAQIDSIHFGTLARYGVPRYVLTDTCVDVFVAAWLLKQKMVCRGNTWRAIGAYHSEAPVHCGAYACSIQRVLMPREELRAGR